MSSILKCRKYISNLFLTLEFLNETFNEVEIFTKL